MRNLQRIHHARYQVDAELPLTATAWDTERGAVIVALGPCPENQIIQLRRLDLSAGTDSRQWPLIASWDAPCPNPHLSCDGILSLHHFSHTETTCLVLAGGDIVVVRERPEAGQEKIEIVGSVDAGISAAAWSPDEEILAVTTLANTLLFMSADFDGIADVVLSPEDANLSRQVSVGWGKAETQFKGKRAKAMRDPTVPERVDEGTLSAFDDSRTTLSWRGDAAFVAINSVESQQRRMIRVYSRDGALDSVSEAVNGMEGALSWKPAGQLIASIQRLANTVNVVFFERNGLRHGEFALRLSAEEMETWGKSVSLAWNHDSTALAVSFLDRVQIWTMGNYHYYMKQEIFFLCPGTSALLTHWHPEEALRLAIGFGQLSDSQDEEAPRDHDEAVSSYNYAVDVVGLVFDMNAGICMPLYDVGATAVIDGKTLKVTPMRVANVPPPMALHDIELPDNAIDVAFNSMSRRIAVLHENSVSLFESSGKLASAEPHLKTTFNLPTTPTKIAHQVCIRDEDDIFVLISNVESGTALIHHASTNLSFSVEGEGLIRLFVSVDYQSLCLASGCNVFELDVGVTGAQDYQLFTETSSICSFPAPAPFVQVQKVNDLDVAFGMTTSGTIFANERMLVKNCTSFLVTHAHLIFTTSNHLIKFVHITDVMSLLVPADEPETDERCRSIERGAKIVTVMPTTFSVVLQMPRGNLETIYPRALVLAAIRNHIAKRDYKSAFMACRAQRVDMNILHDHAPALLLSNIPLFLDQVARPDHVDLFLSQLSQENVTTTMYRETLPRSPAAGDKDIEAPSAPAESLSGPAKVNTICEAFLKVLKTRSHTSTQNVITANLCKSPPDIEAGLRIIAGIDEAEVSQVENAVEHICFLADINQIYDRALGIYDLRLALLIAQQSQKDPREYLPYLQGLQTLSQLRRQYTIDNDLALYSKALEHLQALDDFDAVRAYTRKHTLYTHALELYRYDQTSQQSVLRDYADHLNSLNRFQDAAIAFESLTDYQSASDAYRAANAWRQCLSCASLVPLSDPDIVSLAQALVDDLLESKDFAAAAIICRDYLSDIPSSIRHFCRAYAFSEAFRLIGLNRRSDLLAQVVDPGIAEATGTLTELMADCKSQLYAQVPRLRELRVIKARDPLAFFEGAVNEDIPDNISVAPSAVSTTANTFMTRYTGATGSVATNATRKTSKNKRREERKRARGKKGSIYEEEYLVSSVGRLVERVNSVREDVEATVQACLRRGMRERAKALEEGTREVIADCERVVGEVYEVPRASGAAGEGEEVAGERPQGADGVVWDSVEQSRKRVPPVVKSWTGSRLLARD